MNFLQFSLRSNFSFLKVSQKLAHLLRIFVETYFQKEKFQEKPYKKLEEKLLLYVGEQIFFFKNIFKIDFKSYFIKAEGAFQWNNTPPFFAVWFELEIKFVDRSYRVTEIRILLVAILGLKNLYRLLVKVLQNQCVDISMCPHAL